MSENLNAPIADEDIELASGKIVAVLALRSSEMDELEKVKYIYNQAIKDAIRFTSDMAKSNPVHRMGFDALAKQIEQYMTLR